MKQLDDISCMLYPILDHDHGLSLNDYDAGIHEVCPIPQRKHAFFIKDIRAMQTSLNYESNVRVSLVLRFSSLRINVSRLTQISPI